MRWIRQLVILSLVLGMAACASTPTIRTDYDQTADFSRYRTFGFEPELGTDMGGYTSLLTQRLKEAVSREMTARGYVQQAEDPDLLVNFYARLHDKLRVTGAPPVWGPLPYGYYGYRGGLYDPWLGYGGLNDVQSYTEGTLNIDLIDRQRRQMVWEGVAVGRVDDSTDKIPEQEIKETVSEIFTKYPFQAEPR